MSHHDIFLLTYVKKVAKLFYKSQDKGRWIFIMVSRKCIHWVRNEVSMNNGRILCFSFTKNGGALSWNLSPFHHPNVFSEAKRIDMRNFSSGMGLPLIHEPGTVSSPRHENDGDVSKLNSGWNIFCFNLLQHEGFNFFLCMGFSVMFYYYCKDPSYLTYSFFFHF